MKSILASNADAMGQWVAERAASDLRQAISDQGSAAIVVATGASQFSVLENLIDQPGIDWSVVHGFHLDEYIGLSMDHPASFCKYLKERFVDHVGLADFQYLHGDQDPEETIERVGELLSQTAIDLALVGIGENGHLAFNDPPADFETRAPYLIVELDQPCRLQQVGEGWFDSLADVPTHAISMSVSQIMSAKRIYCSVPDARKADAVRRTLEDPIGPDIPASILRKHDQVFLVTDQAAASDVSDASRLAMETV
jgi:glucosamine-6-phosphate deaminase